MATDLPPLEAFKNRHRGQRCFVVGNAPSLAQLDLPKLEREVTFTVNRGYLAYDVGLPKGTYHVVSDPNTYRLYAREFREAKVGIRFYRSDVCALPEYCEAGDREPAICFPVLRTPTMDEGFFGEDVTKGAYRGFTVLMDAIQLAFTMRFAEVFVIGCDLDYTQDQTHFYATGMVEHARRDIMPVSKVLAAMSVAAKSFARAGRTLANAGVGGKLDSIPRVDFSSLF